METDTLVLPAVIRDDFRGDTIQGAGNKAHADDDGGADFAVPEHHGGCVQLLQRSVHLFLIEFSLLCEADIPAHLFKEFYTAQGVFQIVDGAAEGGLGDSQTGGGNGIVFHLRQYGKITKNVIVH